MLRLSIAIIPLIAAASTADAQGLMRYPDVNGDRVVFTHGGDIWTVPTRGGTAQRLTAHPGLEVFAKISPDGKSVAFHRPVRR